MLRAWLGLGDEPARLCVVFESCIVDRMTRLACYLLRMMKLYARSVPPAAREDKDSSNNPQRYEHGSSHRSGR